MRSVYQLFQVLRRSEAAGGSKEVTYVVAERAVVRVLLYCHYLDAVIACLDNAWKHVVLKLLVGADLLGILRHTYVALINEQRRSVWLEGFLLPFILLLWCPYLSGEYLGVVVLHHAAYPCWYALTLSAVPFHQQFEEVAMLQCIGWQFYLPVLTVLQLLHGILLILFPVVEVAYEVNLRSIRSPFSEYPSLVSLMQSVVQVACGKVSEFLLASVCQVVSHPHCMVVSATNSVLVWLQPWVTVYYAYVLRCCGCLGNGFLHCLLSGFLSGSGLGGFLCFSHSILVFQHLTLKTAFLNISSLEMQGV